MAGVGEPIDFDIDGVNFRMVHLDGVSGMHFALEVMRIFGAAASGLARAEGNEAALLAALSMVKNDSADKVLDMLAACTQVETGANQWKHLKLDVRKDVFRGRQLVQFKFLGKAMQVQLSDFFGLMGSG
jgi:hypothetical protein